MRKNKVLILLLIIILLSGCNISKSDYNVKTINYNLEIGNTYNESIDFVLPVNAYDIATTQEEDTALNLEFALLKTDDQYPYYYSDNIYYKKKINKYDDRINVSLKYNYTDDEFLYHNYIMSCFENYDFASADDYFEVSLSGEFYCMHDMEQLNIMVSTTHEVEDTNGIEKDNSYNWTIDKDNYQDVSIYYKVKRNYDDMLKSIPKEENIFWKIFKNVLKIGAIIVCIFLLIKFYKKNKKEQEV